MFCHIHTRIFVKKQRKKKSCRHFDCFLSISIRIVYFYFSFFKFFLVELWTESGTLERPEWNGKHKISFHCLIIRSIIFVVVWKKMISPKLFMFYFICFFFFFFFVAYFVLLIIHLLTSRTLSNWCRWLCECLFNVTWWAVIVGRGHYFARSFIFNVRKTNKWKQIEYSMFLLVSKQKFHEMKLMNWIFSVFSRPVCVGLKTRISIFLSDWGDTLIVSYLKIKRLWFFLLPLLLPPWLPSHRCVSAAVADPLLSRQRIYGDLMMSSEN